MDVSEFSRYLGMAPNTEQLPAYGAPCRVQKVHFATLVSPSNGLMGVS